MDKNHLPKVFSQLKDQTCIKESDILCTYDGFWLIYKPISAILGEREIFDFLSGDGQRLECDSFFDDWFLYAVADGGSHVYSLLKLREQEQDAQDGCLELPDQYKQNLGKHSKKASRLPEFIARLNKSAERVICDNNKIYIKDPASPDGYEAAAILATHTGNTSIYSFAAEVEYHARFLIPCARIRLPFIKTSVYESAVRADMSIGDKEFEGPAPYYKPDSKIVRRQQMLHCDKTVN